MAEYNANACMAGVANLQAEVEALFLSLNVAQLDVDEEPEAIEANELLRQMRQQWLRTFL